MQARSGLSGLFGAAAAMSVVLAPMVHVGRTERAYANRWHSRMPSRWHSRPVESLALALAEPSPPGTHVVEQGDTLWGIATDAGVDVATLLQLNGLTEGDLLQIGQTLKLSGSAGSAAAAGGSAASAPSARAAAPRSYTVAEGDTLWSIAQQLETSTAALVEANQLDEPDRLKVGATLVVPTASGGSGSAAAARSAAPSSAATVIECIVGGCSTRDLGASESCGHELGGEHSFASECLATYARRKRRPQPRGAVYRPARRNARPDRAPVRRDGRRDRQVERARGPEPHRRPRHRESAAPGLRARRQRGRDAARYRRAGESRPRLADRLQRARRSRADPGGPGDPGAAVARGLQAANTWCAALAPAAARGQPRRQHLAAAAASERASSSRGSERTACRSRSRARGQPRHPHLGRRQRRWRHRQHPAGRQHRWRGGGCRQACGGGEARRCGDRHAWHGRGREARASRTAARGRADRRHRRRGAQVPRVRRTSGAARVRAASTVPASSGTRPGSRASRSAAACSASTTAARIPAATTSSQATWSFSRTRTARA